MNDNKDKQDDEYDRVFSIIRMLKICTALNKEKDVTSFRHPVTMRTIRTMIWLHPIHCKISVPKYNCLRITPCWSLCADLCDSFKEIGKVPTSGHLGLKSKISEKMLFQPRYTSPMHKICFALNKEKGFASFREQVTMRTIRAMTWFFHIADYCTDLLVYPNNREFTWSNRVYGHFCWNCFWEILSYTQGEFWIM